MELNPNTTEVGTVFPGVGGTYSVDPTTGALTLIEPPTFDEPPKDLDLPLPLPLSLLTPPRDFALPFFFALRTPFLSEI